MRSSRLVVASLVGALLSALAVSAPVTASTAHAAAALTVASNPAKGGLTLKLPPPNGHYATGESAVRLVDDKRADPWVPGRSTRELMITSDGFWGPNVSSAADFLDWYERWLDHMSAGRDNRALELTSPRLRAHPNRHRMAPKI